MTDYREIIRLHSLKFSNVSIANSLQIKQWGLTLLRNITKVE